MAMSLEFPPQTMPNDSHISLNLGTQVARQQWEALKPLIEQIYIRDNKPFRHLAEVLRKDHGFELTKRQFSRKIIEWGFRKNISRGERRMILQTVCNDTRSEKEHLKDRRLKPQKLNNWRRRYRDELQLRTFTLDLAARRVQKNLSTISGEASSGSKETATLHHKNDFRTENLHEPKEVRENDWVDISFLDICQNELPFDWLRLKDPGLPGLVPLFTALRFEWTAPGQGLSPEEVEYEDTLYLLNSEIQDMSRKGSDLMIDKVESCLLLQGACPAHETTSSSPQYPWRDIDNVFWGNTTSPLSEIYVFPPARASLRARKGNVVNLWGSLSTEASNLEMKLVKLEGQFGEHNPAVMAVMEQLSLLYSRLDIYAKAEKIKRKLVNVYLDALGPKNGRTLRAALCVVEILLAQGQHLKAQTTNQTLRSSILKLVDHEHPLAILANYTHARICSGSGMSEEAEKYYRQHLQVMLSLHGPRAMSTIKAMSSLGDEIGSRNPKEADFLLRTAAQLSIELPPVDESPCRSLRFLINKFRGRGAYEESYQMAMMLVQRFSLPLGEQHPTIRKARERLAWSMTAVGKLPESIQLFRAVISQQAERTEEIDQSHVNPWCGLADALVNSGEFDEATLWYKRVFETRMKFYGGSNKITVFTAYRLGYCYYKQGKYVEALNLYTQMIHMLRGSGKGQQAISNFEEYILRIQRKIVEGSSM